MSSLAPYIALAILPAAIILRPEPIDIKWNIKHARLHAPTPPLPPELKEAAERNGRILYLLAYAVICGSIYLLARWRSLSAAGLGFQANRRANDLAWGLIVGSAYVGCLKLGRLVADRMARKAEVLRPGFKAGSRRAPGAYARGNALLWVAIIAAGAFAEEYWRAFCLVSLQGLGHSAALAVGVTSLAYTLAWFETPQRSVAFEIGHYTGCFIRSILYAILFLWSGSLIAPCSAHLLMRLAHLYHARNPRLLSESDRHAAVLCPECGWKLSGTELKSRLLSCPNCGQRLRRKPPLSAGVAAAASAALAFLVPYFLGLRNLRLLLAVPLVFLIAFLGIALLTALITLPKLERDTSLPSRAASVLGLSDPSERRRE